MIATRFMELRRRRGLMAALILVNIGIPAVFLTFRLLAHAIAPHSYGPAGGYEIFSSMVAGVLFVFGFIVAATFGCTAGSVDLTEGMFRHLVVTGRSRLALYLARIPAGLAIIVPMVAVGFTIVCTVCVLAAPTHLELRRRDRAARALPCRLRLLGVRPRRGGRLQLQHQLRTERPPSIMNVLNNVPCGNATRWTGEGRSRGARHRHNRPQAQIETVARLIANQDYSDYSGRFLSPSISLMVKSGLWIELYAVVGFLVGLGCPR